MMDTGPYDTTFVLGVVSIPCCLLLIGAASGQEGVLSGRSSMVPAQPPW